MLKVYFKTFGCRTNIFDTQIMINNLNNFQVTENIEDADFIVVNSCTVTNSADSTCRAFLNKIRRNFPEKKIVFTGCAIRTRGETLFKNELFDIGFGLSEKEKIDLFLQENQRKFILGNLEFLDKTIVKKIIGKSRAFIKIQEGCNFKCSYCIIPKVRGSSRSYSQQHILEQIKILADNGFSEFILTGTNIGSYQNLAQLLKSISKISGVKRIRLGSVEPSQINSEFMEILDEDWFGKYLHIAIQYSENSMLKIMQRRNRVEKDLELFQRLAEHDFALGTDFIVGHPGETDEVFQKGFENLKKYPLTHIHLFSYSKKDGTKSSAMKQLNFKLSNVKNRFKLIQDLIENKNNQFRDLHSKNLEVLFEKKKNGLFEGYDQYFNLIKINSSDDLRGNWKRLEEYNWRNLK